MTLSQTLILCQEKVLVHLGHSSPFLLTQVRERITQNKEQTGEVAKESNPHEYEKKGFILNQYQEKRSLQDFNTAKNHFLVDVNEKGNNNKMGKPAKAMRDLRCENVKTRLEGKQKTDARTCAGLRKEFSSRKWK